MIPGGRPAVVAAGAALLAAAGLAVATLAGIAPTPATLRLEAAAPTRLVDRRGEPLSLSFESRWNLHDAVPLHRMPPLLRAAFVEAEDQRFFEHRGVDWKARLHAMWQNLRAGRVVRGASTLSEQVAGMLQPRRRGLWSRWLEGFEAGRLERRFGKGEILELYLNQVPFAGRRRGVAQAARYYFDRDLDTLDPGECLALAALVRSPSRLDPRRPGAGSDEALRRAVEHLAVRMRDKGLLGPAEATAIRERPLELRPPALPVEAPHFVRHARRALAGLDEPPLRAVTHLDGALQRRATALLEHQLEVLARRRAGDGAVLVVDHRQGEILAWVNAGGFSAAREASQIDAVLAARQPGSTLKPFLYALALERGWTAATLIDDAPFAGPVGHGLHSYRNYSRRFYGPVRLREALGNSLNVPAVRTARAVTPTALFRALRELGFDSLDRHPDVYGEGLALGNGEVTLYELVRAYAALARGGTLQPLRALAGLEPPAAPRRVLSEEVSSIVADILSDPEARRLEFGAAGILDLPVQTGVKTGTSNDYRDAWAVGFSHRHTVGVWMGNLDRREMRGVSGSVGPAVVLRGVFAELRRTGDSRPLRVSPALRRLAVCRETGLSPGAACPVLEEWFRPAREPAERCARHPSRRPREVAAPLLADVSPPRLAQPTPGLHLAMDPRIPDDLEAFPFKIESAGRVVRVSWFVDGEPAGATGAGEKTFAWPLEPGEHRVRARVWLAGVAEPVDTQTVGYLVR